MATVLFGDDFEWDDAKAAANLAKHGVSFPEAAGAFEDPNCLILESPDGQSYRLIGLSLSGRVLTVVHVERGLRDRIVSAWVATHDEELRYQQG
jgi:uncharacterized protein